MGKTIRFLIQLNPILFLMGYMLMHSFLGFAFGGGSRTASVAFNGVLLALSIFIIMICSKDFIIEKGRSFLTFFSVLLMLYALRMVTDIFIGPFSTVLPHSQMWDDVLMIVGGAFFPTWAMISSRKHIDVQKIATGVFWTGLFACVFFLLGLLRNGLGLSFEDERLDVGGSLHSLALARLGAIEVLAALHMLINSKKKMLLYLFGLIIGLFVSLASGGRGGITGVIIAVGVYSVMAMRKNGAALLVSILGVIIFIINFETILLWLGNYFPVISNRMLLTITEGDLSDRDILYDMAYQRIIEHPLFGFGYRLKADATGYGPHNGILDVVLCLGIPMGVVFAFFVYIKGSIYSMIMMEDRSLAFPCLLSIFALASSISSSSVPTGSFDCAIALLGITYYYHYSGKHNKQVKKKKKKR